MDRYLMIASSKNWYAPIHIRPLLDNRDRHIGYEHIKNAIHDRKKFGNGNWKYDIFSKKSIMDSIVKNDSPSRIYFRAPNTLSPYDRFIVGSKRSVFLQSSGPEITKEIYKKFRKEFPESPLFQNGENYPYGSSNGASGTILPREEKETLFFLELVRIDISKTASIPGRVTSLRPDKNCTTRISWRPTTKSDTKCS